MDGKPIQYRHYAPYGEMVANQQTTGYDERFKFTGKEHDAETGFDYFGARYYLPIYSIFGSVDPLTDENIELSSYMYCEGNPITYVDPDGRELGFWGNIQTPGLEASKYNSPSDDIFININNSLSPAGRAETFSHEAYGHALLYSRNLFHRHIVENGIEKNILLKYAIIRALAETRRNMKAR